MSLKSLTSQPILAPQSLVLPSTTSEFSSGHAHFWERAARSRRSFLKAAGTTLAVGLALPSSIRAGSHSLPNPIPGGLDLLGNGQIFHVYLPGTAPELSTITDFNGVLGAADVQGTWTGGGVTPPPDTPLLFDADMRFMSGEYIGRDGRHGQGTFVLV